VDPLLYGILYGVSVENLPEIRPHKWSLLHLLLISHWDLPSVRMIIITNNAVCSVGLIVKNHNVGAVFEKHCVIMSILHAVLN